jgi:hypothetical protein
MAKILRVHELAKALDMDIHDVLALCAKLGIGVKTKYSTIIDVQAERVRARAAKDNLGRYSDPTTPIPSDGCLAHCPAGWKVSPCPVCLDEINLRDAPPEEQFLSDSILYGDPPIRLVVFDLDGTLANTDSLPSGYRSPYQILEPGIDGDHLLINGHLDHQPPSWRSKDWSFGANVSQLPGNLIEAGYSVAVVTRAPLAYASTLIHLLGISTQVLRPSCGGSAQDKAQVLIGVAENFGVEPAEMLYVGDLEVDKSIAQLAQCRFAPASVLHSGELWQNLPLYAPRRKRASKDASTVTPPSSTFSTSPDPLNDSLIHAALESIRGGIPDTELHTSLLYKISRSQTCSRRTFASLTFFSLLVRPGSHERFRWQMWLFENLEPGAGSCLIRNGGGLIQIDPRIITRNEIHKDGVVTSSYLDGLRTCLPGTEQLTVGSISLRAAFKFSMDQNKLGSCLTTAKHYSKARGSGPQVQLGYLDFISDILASYVDELKPDLTQTMIVPVPSSPFSQQRVGQVSQRLAIGVSKLLGIPIWPVVHKTTGEEFNVAGLRDWQQLYKANRIPPEAILIEDQCTTGKSIGSVAEKLQLQGIIVHHAVAYSTSLEKSHHANLTQSTCYFREISKLCGMKCQCGD